MAEFDTPQIGYSLHINGEYHNTLDIEGFSFVVFAENQYGMYNLIHERAGLHKLFEACYRDNLHSIWAGQELYRLGNSKEEFYNILQKNMQPVYDSARRQGYEIWNYS